MPLNKRITGIQEETACMEYLISQGLTILERNYQKRQGEIDIIALDGDILVFFEVKYRSSIKQGYAASAVSKSKQKKICRISDFYRMEKHITEERQMRYDVLAIDGNVISWYKNAFEYQ